MDDSNSGGAITICRLEVSFQSGRDLMAFKVFLRNEKQFQGI